MGGRERRLTPRRLDLIPTLTPYTADEHTNARNKAESESTVSMVDSVQSCAGFENPASKSRAATLPPICAAIFTDRRLHIVARLSSLHRLTVRHKAELDGVGDGQHLSPLAADPQRQSAVLAAARPQRQSVAALAQRDHSAENLVLVREVLADKSKKLENKSMHTGRHR